MTCFVVKNSDGLELLTVFKLTLIVSRLSCSRNQLSPPRTHIASLRSSD